MSTPTLNNNDDTKKKRTHLSPLHISAEKHLVTIRYREPKIKVKDHSKLTQRSFSCHNVSDSIEQFDKENNSQTFPRITYDDRYIPRPIRDMPLAYDNLNGAQEIAEKLIDKEVKNLNEGIQEKYEILRSCISESDLKDDRILSFARPAPKAHEGGMHRAIEFVKTCSARPRWKLKRCVPKIPERVLDAPELVNDYYLNLLDWGGEHSIAIGLGNCVYIWNANTGEIHKIDPPETAAEFVSSVKWSGNSSSACLAVGYNTGYTKLYDIRTNKCLRTLCDGNERIPSLSWNENILSCGTRRGVVVNYDVRVRHATISRLENHCQEVCGLSWSPDGRHLASGGNDNNVYVWEKTGVLSNCHLHNFVSHRAAVKAVSWHPRECYVLVTGGGTSDHCLNFWNVHTGSHLSSLQTNSQVSGIVWNPRADEFVTSHGHPQNQLTLWSYPAMEVAAHLISHTNRILSLAASPDGTTVASVGADETLRLWKCFDPPPKKPASVQNDDAVFASKRHYNLH